MGLGIALVDFKGEILDRVDDTHNLLHRLLPPASEDSESLLSKIDWYGDTYFNYLQMKKFLGEWDQLAKHAETSEQRTLIVCIRDLAIRCQKDRDVLRFIGD